MVPFSNVVVGIDFSETSTDALEAALELVAPRHGRVHLLYVVPDALRSPWNVEGAGFDLHGLQRQWIEGGEERLAAFAAERKLDPRLGSTAVAVGHPADELLRHAAAKQANAIVLGAHGHGAVRRFVLGSVADRVARGAPCPVMVVPHRTARLTPFEAKAAAGVGGD
jgi:nucleotide-binding universal stress UspA family protein